MARYRTVEIGFWEDPLVSEGMCFEEKCFYIYLLTNMKTTQIGIYQITMHKIAFDLGKSLESVHSLMERFIKHHKLIRYNPETREVAIKYWGNHNLYKGGKPIMDCIDSQLQEVKDTSLIPYVAASIPKWQVAHLFQTFYKSNQRPIHKNASEQADDESSFDPDSVTIDDTFKVRHTRGGQEEEEQPSQNAFLKNLEKNQLSKNLLSQPSKADEVKEIIEFWDMNGFGFSNLNAKEQLLAWLDDSKFLQPKQVIITALKIACANNKRKLSYVVGILKNWQNESLLTVEEIDSYQEKQKLVRKPKQLSDANPTGRAIPGPFQLDLTAGED